MSKNYDEFREYYKDGRAIVDYIYDFSNGRKKPIGVMVAVKLLDDTVNIGFAFCNPKDSFNKNRGRYIAFNRAMLGSSVIIPNKEILAFVPGDNFFLRRNLTSHVYKLLNSLVSKTQNHLGPLEINTLACTQ